MSGQLELQAELAAPAVRVIGHRVYGTYDTARGIAELVALFGWVIVAVGVLIAILGFSIGAPFNYLVAGIGVGVGAIGLLLVAAQQMLRAIVDSADYARQSFLLQIGMAEGRTEIDVGRAISGTATLGVEASDPDAEQEMTYKGHRIQLRGRDWYIEGHDQPYIDVYTAKIVIDRGDLNR